MLASGKLLKTAQSQLGGKDGLNVLGKAVGTG